MRDSRLLKTQCNSILRLVQKAGLAPIEFRWDEVEVHQDRPVHLSSDFSHSQLVSILRHVPTEAWFRFGPEYDEYSPGPKSRTEASRASGWDTHVVLINDWLHNVKREYEAPDLWELLRQDTKLLQLASSPDLSNDSFTEPEKQYIRQQFAEIKQHLISDHHLQAQQVEILEQRFSYLENSLNRFGKKDWVILVIGTLVSTAQWAFPPTVVQDMIHRVMSAVHPLYDSILRLLG